MAARRRSEDEAPEVGLVADPDGDADEGAVPEGFSVADDEDDEDLDDDEDLEDDDLEDDDEDLEDEGLDEADLADVDAVLAGPAAVTAPVAPADVDEEAAPRAVIADDDEDEIEGIRDDIEFVCVRCRLVKRTSQLAKGARKKEPFCRSCA